MVMVIPVSQAYEYDHLVSARRSSTLLNNSPTPIPKTFVDVRKPIQFLRKWLRIDGKWYNYTAVNTAVPAMLSNNRLGCIQNLSNIALVVRLARLQNTPE